MVEHSFRAPWSKRLTLTTVLVALLLGTVVTFSPGWGRVLVAGIVLATAAFAVLGYRVGSGEVRILRPGWVTRYALSALERVEIRPNAMRGSIRLFGIGGLFGYIGRFRNRALGSYLAYATDEARTVVLTFPDETIVVTPDDPHAFVDAIHAERGAAR